MTIATKHTKTKAIQTLGRGKTAVSILPERQVVGDKEYVRYLVHYSVGNKRIRKRFSDLKRAEQEAEALYANLKNGQTSAAEYTDADRHQYLRATKALALLPEEGWSLDNAVEEFARAQVSLPEGIDVLTACRHYAELLSRLPENTSLQSVVEDFAERKRQIKRDVTIREAVDEFIDSRVKSGCSAVHVKDLRVRLTRFGEAIDIHLGKLTKPLIKAYLDERKVGPRSIRNEFRHIQTFLRWAKRQDCCTKELVEQLGEIELPRIRKTATPLFTPAELVEILESAERFRPDLVPAIVICAFCGIRTAEVYRLDWENVKLARGVLEITAGNAKTGARRAIGLCDAAKAWLHPYHEPNGPVCPVRGENRLYEAILSAVNRNRTAKKVKPRFRWKRNGFRHAYCSYRLAITQNINAVALEAGNSPPMIHSHYKDLVDIKDAEKWFGSFPADDAKILNIEVAV